MSFNLTSNQRDDLKWIVECVEAGEIEESFIVDWMADGSIKRENWTEVPLDVQRKVKRGTLEAWDRSGLVIVTFRESMNSSNDPISLFSNYNYARCTLTQTAYDAVAASFIQPGRTINPRRPLAFLSTHFSMNELRTVAAMLGIPHENIEGGTVEVYARELVTYAQRRNLVWELVSVALSLD